MTAQQLLIPRYEVIAPWPSMKRDSLEVGQVLLLNNLDEREHIEPEYYWFDGLGVNVFYQSTLEKYPHLFRKMNWWEGRKEEDMPKRLKHITAGKICEVKGWDMSHEVFRINSNPLLFDFIILTSYAPID